MKKAEATKATTQAKKQERVYGVKYRPVNEIIAGVIEPKDGKGATRYELADNVELGIVFTDKEYDFGYVDFFGLNVNVTIKQGKSGMFLSFPSYKNKSGEYVDLVRVFDKNFHSCVKALLERLYAEE